MFEHTFLTNKIAGTDSSLGYYPSTFDLSMPKLVIEWHGLASSPTPRGINRWPIRLDKNTNTRYQVVPRRKSRHQNKTTVPKLSSLKTNTRPSRTRSTPIQTPPAHLCPAFRCRSPETSPSMPPKEALLPNTSSSSSKRDVLEAGWSAGLGLEKSWSSSSSSSNSEAVLRAAGNNTQTRVSCVRDLPALSAD